MGTKQSRAIKIGHNGARLLGEALRRNSTLKHLNLVGSDVTQQHGQFFVSTACQVQILRRRFGEFTPWQAPKKAKKLPALRALRRAVSFV